MLALADEDAGKGSDDEEMLRRAERPRAFPYLELTSFTLSLYMLAEEH